MSPFLHWGLRCLLAMLVGACAAHSVENPTPYSIYLDAPSAEPEKYILQPGDQLEIRFFYTPERNVLLPVRPDGYISLPLVNELRAAGRTADDLRLAITAACERTLKTPEVSVIVRSFSAYKIHVGGHVAKPGIFELAGTRTVLEAIFEAGSALPTASLKDVIVIRPKGGGTFAVIPIDIEAVLAGRETRQNIQLRPYDSVFVPASRIADINRWVDQYIRQNIPISFGLDFKL